MKTENDIKEGDRVTVYTEVACFDGIVRYMPAATGDSWHIEEDNLEGKPIRMRYVQTYHEIIKNLL